MVILKARSLSFVVLLLLANLSGVDDRFDKGVCNWSCAVENANATGEAITIATAEGGLLKLTIKYMERVDSARCANETKLDTVIFNTTTKVWLKPSIDYQTNMTKGSMASITLAAMLDVFFSGQLFTGSYIEMKVSCIFGPTFKENSSTNVYYQRLRPLHNPLSILYYVENLANYTKTNSTLVLMKVGQQTRISLVTTGAAGDQSPYTSVKDNELLTFSAGEHAFVVFICIIITLYSPSIFLFLRPSKGKVKLPKDFSTLEKHPVENSGGNDEDQSDTSKDEEENHSVNTSDSFEGVAENGEHRTERKDLSTSEKHPVENSGGNDEDHSDTSKDEEHRTEQAVRRDICEETRPACHQVSEPVDPCLSQDFTRTNSMPCFVGQAFDNKVSLYGNPYDVESNNTAAKDRVLPDTAESPDTPGGPCQSSTTDGTSKIEHKPVSIADDSHAIIIEDNDSSGVDVPQIVPTRVVESGKQNLTRQPGQSSTLDEIPETEDSHVIIVGDTNPLGVGSFIGNSLFSSFNVSKKLKALRLSIILILSFCFIGLVELLLIILPSSPKRISVGLPSPFFSNSVFHSIIKYPAPFFLVILSALCYFIRLFSICYLLSGNYEQTGVSCSLHSKHFICVMYEGLQSLLSKLPKSLCNLSKPCRSGHWICIVWNKFYQLLLCVINFLLPVYESYNKNARECFEYCDVPQNVLLTLEKQVSVTAGYWNAFVERCTGSDETNRCISFMKMLFSPLAIIPFVLDIIVSSPLVYLCHEHQWILRELFKNKFKCSYTICSLFDIVISVFSLVWLIFSWDIYRTVPLGVLIVGIIKTLASDPIALLSEVIIVIFSVHYLWSCYGAFTKFYYDLVYKLGSSYQKKYDELKEQPGENVVLVNYKQGEEGHSIKVIPEKLFKNVCKDRNLLISKQVVCLLLKLFSTIILTSFVWPIISREAVMAKISPVGELSIVISFFAVAYPLINNYINGEKLNVSEEDVNNFVKDYIEEVRGSG